MLFNTNALSTTFLCYYWLCHAAEFCSFGGNCFDQFQRIAGPSLWIEWSATGLWGLKYIKCCANYGYSEASSELGVSWGPLVFVKGQRGKEKISGSGRYSSILAGRFPRLEVVARGRQLSSLTPRPHGEGRGRATRLQASELPLGSELPAEGRGAFSGWNPSPSLHSLSRLGQQTAVSWFFTTVDEKRSQQNKAVGGRADDGICCRAQDWTVPGAWFQLCGPEPGLFPPFCSSTCWKKMKCLKTLRLALLAPV